LKLDLDVRVVSKGSEGRHPIQRRRVTVVRQLEDIRSRHGINLGVVMRNADGRSRWGTQIETPQLVEIPVVGKHVADVVGDEHPASVFAHRWSGAGSAHEGHGIERAELQRAILVVDQLERVERSKLRETVFRFVRGVFGSRRYVNPTRVGVDGEVVGNHRAAAENHVDDQREETQPTGRRPEHRVSEVIARVDDEVGQGGRCAHGW
jgi:hypothetical protein